MQHTARACGGDSSLEEAKPISMMVAYFLAGFLIPFYLEATLLVYGRPLIVATSTATLAAILLSSLIVLVVHELAHYITARLLGYRAKITTLLRYGALQVEYLDPIPSRDMVLILLAPLLLVEAPILLWLRASSGLAALALTVASVIHLSGATNDIVGAVYIALLRRSCVFTLDRAYGRVVGWIEECKATSRRVRLGSPWRMIMLALLGLMLSVPLARLVNPSVRVIVVG